MSHTLHNTQALSIQELTRKSTVGAEEMRERKKSRKREIRVDVRREDAAVWESRGQQLASRPLPSSWSLCAWQHGGNKHSLFSCILLQAVCDPVNADRCIPPSALHDSMCARLEEVKLSYWAHLVQLCSLQLPYSQLKTTAKLLSGNGSGL